MKQTRENLQGISKTYIEKSGAGFFVRRAINLIEEKGWKAVGVSSVRTSTDATVLREQYGR